MASLIYNERNRIRFTSISEKYCIPPRYRAKQNELHSALIEYVVRNFRNTAKFKSKVVDALNILTYCVLENEAPSFNWKVKDPLSTIPDFDMDRVRNVVGGFYLEEDAIEWDVTEVESAPELPEPTFTPVQVEETPQIISKPEPVVYKPVAPVKASSQPISSVAAETPKEDLYIQAPKCPQFDYSSPWLSVQDGDDILTIYTTLPEIPSKQNEISVTTDVNKMTDAELMKLYPKQVIHTRSAALYERIDGIEYDENLGCILPINGFSPAEVRDNIIRYPHFYRLKRYSDDGEVISFYEDIELEGDLESVAATWDSLPESRVIPKQSEFIKEYVVRRYLLEKESGTKHRYPMYGTLDPFLTLFMPPELYIKYGFTDVVEIARKCVTSRVSYKQSRNPILKRLNISV